MNGLTLIFFALFVICAVLAVAFCAWYGQAKRERDNWRATADMRKRELDELQVKYDKLEKDPWGDLPRGHNGNKGKFAPRNKKGGNNNKSEKK